MVLTLSLLTLLLHASSDELVMYFFIDCFSPPFRHHNYSLCLTTSHNDKHLQNRAFPDLARHDYQQRLKMSRSEHSFANADREYDEIARNLSLQMKQGTFGLMYSAFDAQGVAVSINLHLAHRAPTPPFSQNVC